MAQVELALTEEEIQGLFRGNRGVVQLFERVLNAVLGRPASRVSGRWAGTADAPPTGPARPIRRSTAGLVVSAQQAGHPSEADPASGVVIGAVVLAEQIANWLPEDFPEDEVNRISHDTIHRELYLQGSEALQAELIDALRTFSLVAVCRPEGVVQDVRAPKVRVAGMTTYRFGPRRPSECRVRGLPGVRPQGYLCLVTLPSRGGPAARERAGPGSSLVPDVCHG